MSELRAGTGKTIITPRTGVEMIGYFNRPGVSQGAHDDLCARALVLDDGAEQVALSQAARFGWGVGGAQ